MNNTKRHKVSKPINQTIRAFVAIEVSQELMGLCKKINSELKIKGFLGKEVDPKNSHITLAFFGETEISKEEAILKCLKCALTNNMGFEITINGVGAFGRRRPKVIFLKINHSEDLKSLFEIIQNALKSKGFSFDERNDNAHITLMRVKSWPLEWKKTIKEIKFKEKTLKVNKVSLFSSTITPRGAIYNELGYVALKEDN